MKLNEIGLPPRRPKKKIKRVGRGDGSGHGGTAGRGHKGQKARAGGMHKRGFEGGQMPLRRRLPKRGFTNIFRKEFSIINLDQLKDVPSGTEVTSQYLCEEGIISRVRDGVKLLGRGELKKPLTIKLNAISESAQKKVVSAGGKVEVIGV